MKEADVKAGSPENPLGIVKIPIGLPSLIHGGKSQAQLGGFASHGCVGLTNQQVKEFAPLLARLGGANLSDEQMAEYLKNKEETKPSRSAMPWRSNCATKRLWSKTASSTSTATFTTTITNTEQHCRKCSKPTA